MNSQKQSKTDFKPIPEGEYLVRINRIQERKTKKGDPKITVSYQVIKPLSGGEDAEKGVKNRLIFDDFILEHENPQVPEITKSRLNFLLKAVGEEKGLEGIGHDYSQLENYLEMPFVADVKIQENPGYKAQNRVYSFKRR